MNLFPTPYIRNPIPFSYPMEQGVPSKYTNYTDLDLFRLETNLPAYLDPRRELIVMVEQRDDGFEREDPPETDVIRIYIRLTESDLKDAEISEEERKAFVQAVEEVCSPQNRSLLHLFSYTPILRSKKDVFMDPSWVCNMLPRAPYRKTRPIFHHVRGMYLNVGENYDYVGLYGRFLEWLVGWIREQYDRGVLPCIITEQFANDWNLTFTSQNYWIPKKYNPQVMGEDTVVFYTQKVRLSDRDGFYLWTTPPFYNHVEQRRFEEILDANRLRYELHQEEFQVEVTGYDQCKRLLAQHQARLTT